MPTAVEPILKTFAPAILAFNEDPIKFGILVGIALAKHSSEVEGNTTELYNGFKNDNYTQAGEGFGGIVQIGIHKWIIKGAVRDSNLYKIVNIRNLHALFFGFVSPFSHKKLMMNCIVMALPGALSDIEDVVKFFTLRKYKAQKYNLYLEESRFLCSHALDYLTPAIEQLAEKHDFDPHEFWLEIAEEMASGRFGVVAENDGFEGNEYYETGLIYGK